MKAMYVRRQERHQRLQEATEGLEVYAMLRGRRHRRIFVGPGSPNMTLTVLFPRSDAAEAPI